MSFRVRSNSRFRSGFIYDLGLVKARVTLVEAEDAQLDPKKKTEPELFWMPTQFDRSLLKRRG